MNGVLYEFLSTRTRISDDDMIKIQEAVEKEMDRRFNAEKINKDIGAGLKK